MSLPTLAKTWHISANNTTTMQVNTITTCKNLWLNTKRALTGYAAIWPLGVPATPWTVVSSSNSIVANTSDNWNSVADLIGATNGNAHSWIVLKQTGIATNFQICLDFNETFNSGSIIVSENAGFTGGSTTNRPTATDEQVLINAAAVWGDSTNAQAQLDVWMASDGSQTRVAYFRGGFALSFMMFDKPAYPVSGWTRPWYAFARAGYSGGNVNTYSNLLNNSTSGFASRGSGAFTGFATGEGGQGTNQVLAGFSGLGDVANSFSAEYHLFPIGYASITTNNKGRHGMFVDAWWKPMGMSNADSFPVSSATKQFVVVGDIILPWIGDSTSLLTS